MKDKNSSGRTPFNAEQRRQSVKDPDHDNDQNVLETRPAETVQTLMGEEEEYSKIDKISKNLELNGTFKVHGRVVQYSKKSLFLFEEENKARKFAVNLIQWRWFDRFMMVSIFANTICLGLYDYSDRESQTTHNKILDAFGVAFTLLFLLEAMLKIFAMGFVHHKYSYLRDGWNIVDFIITIAGQDSSFLFIRVIDLGTLSGVNLKPLRIFRMFRPLRSINTIPKMRKLVTSLIQSLPELGNATIFLAFVIMLYSILGLQQFNGVLYNRCRVTSEPDDEGYWPKLTNKVCSKAGDGDYTCPADYTCGKKSYKVKSIGNPLDHGISLEDDGVYNDPLISFGVHTFDHFGKAVVTVFQLITRHRWTAILYNLSDGYTSIFAKIYCVTAVFLGHYFLLKAILAILVTNFTKAAEQEAELELIKTEQQLALMDAMESKEQKTKEDKGDVLNKSQEVPKDEKSPINAGSLPAKSKTVGLEKTDTKPDGNNIEKPKEETVQEPINPFKQLALLKKQKQEERAREERERLEKERLEKEKEEKAKEENKAQEEPMNPFKQLALLKKQKQEERAREAEKARLAQENGEKDGNAKQEDPKPEENKGRNLGLALFGKAFGMNRSDSDDDIQEIQNKLKNTENIKDLNQKLQMQNKIHEEQDKKLMRINLEINKKLLQSKKTLYGIENETSILNQVQRSLQKAFTEREQKLQQNNSGDDTNDTNNEEVEKELDDETQISLSISQTLKEQTMKHQIKEMLFNKFKSQLVKKNMLLRMFLRLETQMLENMLSLRANKFIFFKLCLAIVRSYIFNILIVLSIFGNAVVLSLEKYPIDLKTDETLQQINFGFFVFFALELIIKLSAYGFKFYFNDKFNWFDCAVVLVSAVDEILLFTNVNDVADSGAISALRIFRLIRIFQLAKYWKEFQDLFTVLIKTVKDIAIIAFLLLIFIIFYSLLGMEIFAYKAKFDSGNKVNLESGTYPTSTFNTFSEAFMTVFIILTNGWTGIYFDHYRATDPATAIFYFGTLLIAGQFILLNLFMSFIIKNFQLTSNQAKVKPDRKDTWKQKILDLWNKVLSICKKHQQKVIENEEEEEDPEKAAERKKLEDEEKQRTPSLFLFAPDTWIRKFCTRKVTNWKFEYIMLLFIIANSVQLAMDSPLNDPKSVRAKALIIVDGIVLAVYIIEAIMKIIAFGFAFCGSTSYIRSGWNIVDFAIIILSIVYLSLAERIEVLQILRLVKVLKTINVIKKFESLRISIKTLGNSFSGIIKVIAITLIFFIIFGIIGIHFLKGRLYSCDSSHVKIDKSFTIRHKWDCLSLGGEWQNFFQNFDSILEALATLFMAQTLDNWAGLMYRGISAVDIDYQPKTLNNLWIAIYFIVNIVVGNFFLSNLYVGVLTSTYNREKEKVLGNNYLVTASQKKGSNKKLSLIQTKPKLRMKLPMQEWRQPFFYIAQHKYFEMFTVISILINTVILAICWYGQSSTVLDVTDTICYVLAILFVLEIALRIVAYGKLYFKDGWNIFDMIVVILNLISMILTSQVSSGSAVTILKTFRIGRIIKLFRNIKSLKHIFEAFIFALPALANVGGLLLLFIFIYAILGMYLFGDVMFGGAINEQANFQYIGTAFLTLIRVTSGDTWTLLFQSYSREYSHMYQCKYHPTYDDYVANGYKTIGCGNLWVAVVYFFSYVLLIQMIYLKLFTALLISGFRNIAERENKVFNSDISEKFRNAWSFFDPDGTSYIRVAHYPHFLLYLGEPLGWDKSYEYNFLKQQEYLQEVKLPIYNRNRHYALIDVFENLALQMIVKKELTHYMNKHNKSLNKSKKMQQAILATDNFDIKKDDIEDKKGDDQSLIISLESDREQLKNGDTCRKDLSIRSSNRCHSSLADEFRNSIYSHDVKVLPYKPQTPGFAKKETRAESSALNRMMTQFTDSNKLELKIKKKPTGDNGDVNDKIDSLVLDNSLLESDSHDQDKQEEKKEKEGFMQWGRKPDNY